MFCNLLYEHGNERKTISLDFSTTTMECLDYFTHNGWVIVDYSEERRG